jgi:CspA family cold shock protein
LNSCGLRTPKNFDRIGFWPARMALPRRTDAGRNEERSHMRQIGTVKFFNEQKGFGFIKPDDGGNDIFVHITALQQSGLQNLAEGMRISFETEPDKRGKGPKAVQLRPEQ